MLKLHKDLLGKGSREIITKETWILVRKCAPTNTVNGDNVVNREEPNQLQVLSTIHEQQEEAVIENIVFGSIGKTTKAPTTGPLSSLQ